MAISMMTSFLSFAVSANAANYAATVYAKNNSTGILHVWVEGIYQGYVPRSGTRFTVADGFVTHDSGRPTADGGRTSVKESHGGWQVPKQRNSDVASPWVTVYFEVVRGEEVAAQTVNCLADLQNCAFFWVGDTNPGPAITDEEAERSEAILKGNRRRAHEPKKIPWFQPADIAGEYQPVAQDPQSQSNGRGLVDANGKLSLQCTTVFPKGNSASYELTAQFQSLTGIEFLGRQNEPATPNRYVRLTFSINGSEADVSSLNGVRNTRPTAWQFGLFIDNSLSLDCTGNGCRFVKRGVAPR